MGPWDGPHPGLAMPHASSGSHLQYRAPLGLVRLPQSLLPPRRTRHSRASGVNSGVAAGSRSGHQPADTVSNQSATVRHSATPSLHRTAVGVGSGQADSRDDSSVMPMPAVSSASAQSQPAQDQPSAAQTGNQSAQAGLSQHSSQVGPARDMETGPGHRSSQPQSTADNAAPAGIGPASSRDMLPPAGHQSSLDISASAAPGAQPEVATEAAASEGQGGSVQQGMQEQPARFQTIPSGQLADLPDRPGHLATVEQCRAANGGVCWHLLQMAVKAREIACKNVLVSKLCVHVYMHEVNLVRPRHVTQQRSYHRLVV